MVHDYGLKTFHLISESGEVYYEVKKGESVVVDIDVKGKFDIISFPTLHHGRGVEAKITYFDGNKFKVEITNVSERKKKGNLVYELRGLRVWT